MMVRRALFQNCCQKLATLDARIRPAPRTFFRIWTESVHIGWENALNDAKNWRGFLREWVQSANFLINVLNFQALFMKKCCQQRELFREMENYSFHFFERMLLQSRSFWRVENFSFYTFAKMSVPNGKILRNVQSFWTFGWKNESVDQFVQSPKKPGSLGDKKS